MAPSLVPLGISVSRDRFRLDSKKPLGTIKENGRDGTLMAVSNTVESAISPRRIARRSILKKLSFQRKSVDYVELRPSASSEEIKPSRSTGDSTTASTTSTDPLEGLASPRLNLNRSGGCELIIQKNKRNEQLRRSKQVKRDKYDLARLTSNSAEGSEGHGSTEVFEDDNSENIPLVRYYPNNEIDDRVTSDLYSSGKYPEHQIENQEGHEMCSSITSKSSRTSQLRYSLNLGLKDMSNAQRIASLSTIDPLNNTQETAASSEPSTVLGTGVKKSRTVPERDFKIFLLLLHPETKTFELIQLMYSPIKTTIGDLLRLIPSNSTEPALGLQKYIGLCRPREEEEIMDLDIFASGVGWEQNLRLHANITRGELLVAIPYTYTGKEMAVLSRQILANPKIRKLLRRADPLSPNHKRNSSSRQRKQRKGFIDINIIDKEVEISTRRMGSERGRIDEASAEKPHKYSEKMNEALSKAVKAAAQANAAIVSSKNELDFFGETNESSQTSFERCSLLAASPSMSNKSYISNMPYSSRTSIRSVRSLRHSASCDTSNASFTSWSKSLHTSHSAKRSTRRRRQQRTANTSLLFKGSIAAFSYMVIHYLVDTKGRENKYSAEEMMDAPLGYSGMTHFACMFVLLIKIQSLFCSDMNSCQFLGSFLSVDGQLMQRKALAVTAEEKWEHF